MKHQKLRALGFLHFILFVIFSNVMTLQFLIKYVSYSLILISLSLICNHDNLRLKLRQKKVASLMRNGFLLGDSKLEVFQECNIKKRQLYLTITLHNELKMYLPRKILKCSIHGILKKQIGKSSNNFDQLLIYWKIQSRRNYLTGCNVRFLNCLFKLPSFTLSRVITATMLFLECYACIVKLIKLSLTRSSHVLRSSHKP